MDGCLGPCAMANVVLLVFDGRSTWFQSVNHASVIIAIFDYIESMVCADRWLPPPTELSEYVFDYYQWSQSAAHDSTSEQPTAVPLIRPGILLLTHADTDLLSLHHARHQLPAGFPPVEAISLTKIKTEEHLHAPAGVAGHDGSRAGRATVGQQHQPARV